MHRVGHDGISAELILAKQHATPQRCFHDACDWLLSQIDGTTTSGIEIPIHPDKRRTRRGFAWRRIHCLWETSVKMPGQEKPLSFWMLVRQSAAELSHVNQWVLDGQILMVTAKRRDESRRSRHECLRHVGKRNFAGDSAADL